MFLKRVIYFILLLLFCVSCKQTNKKSALIKEDKFTLSIGTMDNELDFFSREGISFSLESDIYMSNGIFYISNGNGKKIMKFNSYGDLLQKISPIRQSDNYIFDENSWSFNELGAMTSNQKYIYIVDTLEYDSELIENNIDKSKDLSQDKSKKELHILNEKTVSIFDKDGNFINVIGQNGLGTKAFPFIKNIFMNTNNELVVISQTTFFWIIFKFTETGEFLNKNIIEIDYLPQLENTTNTMTQINNIILDREHNRVLVELSFSQETIDEKTNATISIQLLKSRVYYYDLDKNEYISWMDIPTEDSNENKLHYVLLDIVKGKYLYFTALGVDNTSQSLIITNENGYIIGEYDLQIDNANIIYSSFYTSLDEGILTGILCTEYAAGVSMWRTDKIIDEDQLSNGS